MTTRRIIFSNPRNLLIDSTRLAALKTKMDALASDLATLDGMSEAAREADQELRNAVLEKFARLGEA